LWLHGQGVPCPPRLLGRQPDPYSGRRLLAGSPQILHPPSVMISHPEVLIVGAGLTGLAAAHSLQRAGRRVTVLDASSRAGGAVCTERSEGWLAEGGPNSLLVDDPALYELFREL